MAKNDQRSPSKKPGGARPDQPSDEVILAQIALNQQRIRLGSTAVIFAGIAICIAATWLPAKVLAGEETALNITVSLSIAISLAMAGTGAAVWGNHHRKRANRLDARNKDLERDVKELRDRLADNKLPTTVSR